MFNGNPGNLPGDAGGRQIDHAVTGKPAVVTSESGLTETVADGETGFVIPPENPSAAANAVLKFFTNENLRKKFGGNARRRALDNQTWEMRVKDYESFIGEILCP
jgi:glycosyltransferase involved in cell wall biosynthesis